MLRGYRSIVAALGLILAANHAHAKSGGEQPQAHQPVATSLERIAAGYDDATKRAESADQQEAPCGPKQYDSNADLCAQWKAADSAADSAWWAWVGGIIGLGSLTGVFAAIGLAFHSNSIARDTAKRQLRAYLTFSEFILNMEKSDWKLQLEWVNRGQTPATHVHAFADWVALENPLPSDFDFPEPPPEEEDGPASVGPNQAVFASCPQEMSPLILTSAANKDRQVYAWGSVEYLDAFGQRRRTEIAAKLQVEPLPSGGTAMRWLTLGRHNGIDEGCAKRPSTANDDGRNRQRRQ